VGGKPPLQKGIMFMSRHLLTLTPDSSCTSGRLVSGRICCRFLVSNDWTKTGCTLQRKVQVSSSLWAWQISTHMQTTSAAYHVALLHGDEDMQ
jgi:hypothetical protein